MEKSDFYVICPHCGCFLDVKFAWSLDMGRHKTVCPACDRAFVIDVEPTYITRTPEEMKALKKLIAGGE